MSPRTSWPRSRHASGKYSKAVHGATGADGNRQPWRAARYWLSTTGSPPVRRRVRPVRSPALAGRRGLYWRFPWPRTTGPREPRADADELVCPHTPWNFYAIGQFYADFSQTDDEEVVACLEEALARPQSARRAPPGRAAPEDREADVRAGPLVLRGQLTVPEGALGIVLFAHGSGSSWHSPRNRFVAAGLNRAGLGTLLFDLLTEEEETDRANVFDTDLLARRLGDATGWLREQPEAQGLAVGYFGASTGAAAALWAAAEPDARIAALVSRGGRPDLAGPRLLAVTAPTLLIVGGDDRLVLGLNRDAQARLRCENELAVVPGATHLFEEPGTLEQVTDRARDWFTDHMAPAAHTTARF